MRGGLALLLAIAASATLGCEGVPELVFPSADDASTSVPTSTPDATILTVDGSSSPPAQGADSSVAPIEDAEAEPDGDAEGTPIPLDASAPPPPTDAATPATGCPDNPPPGATCCGAVACKGSAKQCNCTDCAFCASEGFCCPSTFPPPGYCATSLASCH